MKFSIKIFQFSNFPKYLKKTEGARDKWVAKLCRIVVTDHYGSFYFIFISLNRQPNRFSSPETKSEFFSFAGNPMPEDSTSIDYVMEKASGPHFSGLRLDGLLSSPSKSSNSSPSHFRSGVSSSLDIADPAAHNQPFVIGDFDSPSCLIL